MSEVFVVKPVEKQLGTIFASREYEGFVENPQEHARSEAMANFCEYFILRREQIPAFEIVKRNNLTYIRRKSE